MLMLCICLCIPVLMVYIMKETIYGEEKSYLMKGAEYLAYLLLGNALCMFILSYLLDNNYSVTEKILTYNDFALKYIVLLFFSAIFVAVAEYFIRHNSITFNIKKNPLVRISPRVYKVLMYLYLMFLFILVLIRIFDNNFWGDEGYSIRLAKQPLSELIVSTSLDVHPPLYYIILRFFYLIGGNYGYIYHMVSVIPIGILLMLCATTIQKRFGKVPAILLATSSVLLPATRVTNVEVRMYSWAYLFVFISFVMLYDILKKETWKSYIGFMTFSLCAAYTHYYALVMVAFLYIVVILRAIHRKSWSKTLVIVILTILGYLPWLGVLLNSFQRTSDSWWLESIPTIEECVVYIFGMEDIGKIFVLSIMLYLIKTLKLVEYKKCITPHEKIDKRLFEVKEYKGNYDAEDLWIFAGLVCAIGTIMVGKILSHTIRPFLILRYLVPLISIVWLLMGILISKLRYGKILGLLLTCHLLSSHLSDYIEVYNAEAYENQKLETFLNDVEIESDAFILTNYLFIEWTVADYYYPQVVSKYASDTIQMKAILSEVNHEKIYLFLESDTSNDVIKVLGDEIATKLVKVSENGLKMSKKYIDVYMLKR